MGNQSKYIFFQRIHTDGQETHEKMLNITNYWCSVNHFWLWEPSGSKHARLPCPSSSPRAGSNSCPLSQWCHPTISSSVIPFSSCLQFLPASGSFPMSNPPDIRQFLPGILLLWLIPPFHPGLCSNTHWRGHLWTSISLITQLPILVPWQSFSFSQQKPATRMSILLLYANSITYVCCCC